MKGRFGFIFVVLLSLCIVGCNDEKCNVKKNTNKQETERIKIDDTIQNDKHISILEGETIYPEQVKAVIDRYKYKYNLDIKYVNGTEEFLSTLKNIKLSQKPVAFFQYNDGHKYGFIFVKYNNIDYCICIDTIPSLSKYTDKLFMKQGKLFIKFNNKTYRVIMFGENLQTAKKGCGYFTLVLLKQLLKNNYKYLFDVILLDKKYSTEDKMERDKNKQSFLRGVKFDILKQQPLAPHIYKYAQSMSLQSMFDGNYLKNGNISFKKYRNFYSTTIKDKNNNDKQISTKIFTITQKYKDLTNQEANIIKYKDKLFSLPDDENSLKELKHIRDFRILKVAEGK